VRGKVRKPRGMSALERKMSSAALIDQDFKLVASQLISDLQGMSGTLPLIPHD